MIMHDCSSTYSAIPTIPIILHLLANFNQIWQQSQRNQTPVQFLSFMELSSGQKFSVRLEQKVIQCSPWPQANCNSTPLTSCRHLPSPPSHSQHMLPTTSFPPNGKSMAGMQWPRWEKPTRDRPGNKMVIMESRKQISQTPDLTSSTAHGPAWSTTNTYKSQTVGLLHKSTKAVIVYLLEFKWGRII